jgi:hypothetical protein
MAGDKGSGGPKRGTLNEGYQGRPTKISTHGYKPTMANPKPSVEGGHTPSTGQIGKPPSTGSAVSKPKKG